MKAWQVHAFGEPETMALDEVARPDPAPGQVRIRIHAAGLNFFDLLQIQGKYQVKPAFPFTPGAEVAGVVDAAGPETQGLRPGDAVLGFVWQGGMGEYALADARHVFAIPPGMDFAEAAVMPVVYHTSWYALRNRAALRPGEWLLVHAGASGTGMSAIQLGRALGASVIATAGSPEKRAFALAQGAAHALDSRDAQWVERVNELTGGGANVIYDPVGGEVFDLSRKCIAPEGRLLVIGFASGRIPSVEANRILLRNMSVVGVAWGAYTRRHPELLAETQAELGSMYAAGAIRPVVAKSYPLDDAPSALRDIAQRKIVGKAVLVVR